MSKGQPTTSKSFEVGDAFGMLIVTSATPVINPTDPHRRKRWPCRCLCGRDVLTLGYLLHNGQSRSCGCQAKFKTQNQHARHHGHTQRTDAPGARGRRTPTYASWQAMRRRCSNPTAHNYANYGGRGIQVCERWSEFENFLADMGERPEGKSVDRIDHNGNYEPRNCRWATEKEQQNNRRSSVHLEFRGQVKPQLEWATEYGLLDSTLSKRLRAGWSLEKALTTPSRIKVRRK